MKSTGIFAAIFVNAGLKCGWGARLICIEGPNRKRKF